MPIEIGKVAALFRYPVKSMSGELLESAELGWHGLEGDRRFAFRRLEDRSGFPWLNAGKLPDLLRYVPLPAPAGSAGPPTHVRTPDGETLELAGEALAAEVGKRHGAQVQMMQIRGGIYDEADISVIASATVNQIASLALQSPDVRRFRPNVLVDTVQSLPFEEDGWLGGVLTFGEGAEGAGAPAITVTLRDERCVMLNLDPDSARSTPSVLKAVVRANRNTAGVYATTTRCGRLAVGQAIHFEPFSRTTA